MGVSNLENLFIDQLSDMYSAEKQLTKALPKLAKAAADDDLHEAFQSHLQETKGQVQRIEKAAKLCGLKLKRRKCEAMEGLIKEGSAIIEQMEESGVRDAALIAAAQKVEHYEISAYISLLKLAQGLGYRNALPLLEETLDQEDNADMKLSDLGDQTLDDQLWKSQRERITGAYVDNNR
jgi:ferritin-like metal-binding protein YciE